MKATVKTRKQLTIDCDERDFPVLHARTDERVGFLILRLEPAPSMARCEVRCATSAEAYAVAQAATALGDFLKEGENAQVMVPVVGSSKPEA